MTTPQPADALQDETWWTRLYLAASAAVDEVPYAAASEYPAPHAAAFRSAVEPMLRDALVERDALAEARGRTELTAEHESGISECTSACGSDADGGHWHSVCGFVWAQFPRRTPAAHLHPHADNDGAHTPDTSSEKET
jgi:hypothetical protein